MDSGPRWPLIAAIILLGICEWIWIIRSGTSRVHRWQAQFQAKSAQSAVTPWDPAKRHLFTRDEANAFLDAAKKAEAIRDPLQRCLAYPDPPRSHWSHDAVDAYCVPPSGGGIGVSPPRLTGVAAPRWVAGAIAATGQAYRM